MELKQWLTNATATPPPPPPEALDSGACQGPGDGRLMSPGFGMRQPFFRGEGLLLSLTAWMLLQRFVPWGVRPSDSILTHPSGTCPRGGPHLCSPPFSLGLGHTLTLPYHSGQSLLLTPPPPQKLELRFEVLSGEAEKATASCSPIPPHPVPRFYHRWQVWV